MTLLLCILGVACLAYGMLVLSVASGTWFFAFWLALGAALLGCAGAVHAGWWAALPLGGKRALGIAAIALLAGFLATQALIARDFNDQGEDGLDCIIVLGAQVRGSKPSVVLRHRLDTACDYLERNPRTRCIVSGGQGSNEPTSEASVMAAYLESRGIDRSRIIYEDRSTNTRENIAFSAQLLDPATDRVGIVTSNFHVYRGVGIARKAGFAHVVGIAAPTTPLFLPNNLAREGFGIAKDLLAGNL